MQNRSGNLGIELRGSGPPEGDDHIGQIDALRGLAALLLAAFFHPGVVLGLPLREGPLDELQPFKWFYDYGWTLVDLFFVISGFIFAHVYLTAQGELKQGTTLRSFAVARFARLYPLHLVTLLAVAIIAIFQSVRNYDVWHFVLNLLFLQESGLNDGMSFNRPSWSLSVEAFCYALFIMSARTRTLSLIAPLLVVSGVVLTLGPSMTGDNVGRGLVGFFVGYMLWRFRSVPPAPLVALAIVGCLIQRAPINYGVTLALTLWPALVLLSLRISWLSALRWIGDRSYSIYLIHYPTYLLGNLLIGGTVPAQYQLIVQISSVSVVLLLSDLSFRYLESPARQRIRQKLASRPIGHQGGDPASPFQTPQIIVPKPIDGV